MWVYLHNDQMLTILTVNKRYDYILNCYKLCYFFFVRINFVHVSTCILINYWLFFLNQSWMKNNMFCHGRIEHFPEVASVKIVWLLYIQMHRWLQFILIFNPFWPAKYMHLPIWSIQWQCRPVIFIKLQFYVWRSYTAKCWMWMR